MGFLGSYVCREFLHAGWRVVGLGHDGRDHFPQNSQRDDAQPEFHAAEVAAAPLRSILSHHPALSVIVHCAGGGSVGLAELDPAEDYRRSVGTSEAVIAAVAEHRRPISVIYPSSAAVYGERAEMALSEATHPDPCSHYGRHKLLAEQLFQQAHDKGCLHGQVIRFFSLYGAGLRKQLLWDLSQRVLRGERRIELGGTGCESRDFLHVADAARLVRLLSEQAESTAFRTFNGGSGDGQCVKEIARLLTESVALAAQRSVPQVTFSGTRRPGDPTHLVADNSRACELGFQPSVELAQGLDQYANWVVHVAEEAQS